MSDERHADELYLTEESLTRLVDELLTAGTEVIAPAVTGSCASPAAIASAACLRPGAAPELIEYAALHDASQMALGRGLPNLSLKGFFLPQEEALVSWRRRGTGLELRGPRVDAPSRIALGVKPCDAAALEIVDKVMNWDTKDELWNGRREATTVFTLACPVEDESCFCAAVGGTPDGTRGADGLFTPVEGGYMVQATTDKGRAFIDSHLAAHAGEPAQSDSLRRQAAGFRSAARERIAGHLAIDGPAIRDWVAANFDDPLLTSLGIRCNGCGACTSVCPTCHCFDIVDEPDGVSCGTRRRCWDTCQTGRFTSHASGHNPREDQNVRFRQRINHKFAIYPLRFGEILCTGCGRCTRVCHAGQDLVEILSEIDDAARRGRPAVTADSDGGGEG